MGGLDPKDSPPGLAADLVRRIQSDGCSLVGRFDRPYAAAVLAHESGMGEAGPRRVDGSCKNSAWYDRVVYLPEESSGVIVLECPARRSGRSESARGLGWAEEARGGRR